MQHLDDALIAEYLDGETAPEPVDRHLSECATCRSRVDAERTVRARASGILDDGGPGTIVTPSFDDVLIRAGRKPAGRRPRVPLRALAWAATIVLAFGAGWMLRRPGIAHQAGVPPTIEGLVARAPEKAAPASSVVVGTSGAPSLKAGTAPGERPGGEPAAAGGAAGAIASGVPQGLRQAKASEPTPIVEVPRRLDSAPPPQAALANAPGARRAEVAAQVPTEANAAREAVVQAPPAVSLAADALERPDMPWVPLQNRTEVERRFGGPVAIVRGLDARYAVSPDARPSVRVEQPLGAGSVLTLIERRIGGDTAVLATPRRVAADSGFVAMELMREGVRIRASAPISGDSLLVLLRRLD